MKFFTLFIFFTSTALAQFPSSLVSSDNINSIIFKEMKTYMFQVTQQSKVYKVSPNCRLYKFAASRASTRLNIKFCLRSQQLETKINQLLQVTIDGNFAGSFRFDQEGAGTRPLKIEEFISFNYPLIKEGQKSEFYFDYFTFGLIVDKRADPVSINSFIQGYRLNIYEDQAGAARFRRYAIDCEGCGAPVLRVQIERENTRYFVSTNPTEVTPVFFNQMLDSFITGPLGGLGQTIKYLLISELNWPSI